MLHSLKSHSVFTLLLLNTVVSTIIVALVSIASLQRVADEHPRRYLSKVLFHYFANSLDTDDLTKIRLDGLAFEVYPLNDLPQGTGLPFDDLLTEIRRDADGVAIITYDGRYLAATVSGDNIVVLPQFGQLLSKQAMLLVGLVVVTILTVLILNYYAIHYLTAPFLVFKRVVKNVEDGNLSYRVPVDKTYGEFQDLANSFNSMLERLDHVNTARKHMLLAIPHEVRTPLARLKVRKDLIGDQDLKNEITRDINSLENILDTILDTERLQTNEGKVVRKKVVAKAFLEKLASEFSSHQNLHFLLRTTAKSFYADEFLISLLAKNLISNSIRYGRDKPITIELSEARDDPTSLVLSVADQGVGIPKEKIGYVTEPFWRLDESRQRNSGGFGLGMYLCERIVRVHDGTLEILSEVEIGTIVKVTLPGALTPELRQRIRL